MTVRTIAVVAPPLAAEAPNTTSRHIEWMMATRVALALIMMTIGLLVAPMTADAQQARQVPRVGVFFASNPTSTTRNNEAFTQGLRERGYVEGQNIVLERRYGEARAERMAEIAAELVRMKVDVIVATTDQAILAVKRQTRSIPIVMVNSTDPVGTGFVASLAHPGGNITGVSLMSPELGGKRLQLLREALPQLTRLAVIWNPEVRGAVVEYKELEAPARSLGVRLQSVEVSHADDFAAAFSAIAAARAEAVVVISVGPVMYTKLPQAGVRKVRTVLRSLRLRDQRGS